MVDVKGGSWKRQTTPCWKALGCDCYWNSFVSFVWFDSLCPINNLSVIKGQVFLGWTSTKLGLMCLAQGHNTVTPVTTEIVKICIHLEVTTVQQHMGEVQNFQNPEL